MPICPRCLNDLPDERFGLRYDRPGRKSSCKTCLRRSKRDRLQALKRKPCADCGAQLPTALLDFDHLPQYRKAGKVCSARTFAEAAKCEVVCKPCHRLRTKARRQVSVAHTS